MLPLSDVQEHSVNEEKKRFNVQVLAPAQTKVKTKF